MKQIHLICNAHLDPVWQWEWEEGAAAAVSTFRVAADFCEEYGTFIFNHNEVILYKWIEEYEPALFERIQKLVQAGKWHIMGGWYLQPDCNMPSGESFVRQILLGRQYFREKFGVEPTTAVNVDSFGHTRGLVQILKKSGYDSYLFMRPDDIENLVPDQDFTWVGYDGSTVTGHRIWGGYNTLLGQADTKIRRWMEENPDKSLSLVTWGIGDHGGGPSRIDLEKINRLIDGTRDFQIQHSSPEQYFSDLAKSGRTLPRHEKDLNPRFVGCYTSQIRIKQKHRLLENELYKVEKMVSAASMQGLMTYPGTELHEAFCDLMTSEFHDILPGSSVQPVEETSIRMMDHGLEIASKLKARAFFALSSGQAKAAEGEIPVLIYNPHPFKIKGIFECEFMLADQNWKDEFSMPVVFQDGHRVPSQPEKENSNLNLDWRKRVVFAAELEPSRMNRFDCRIEAAPKKPEPVLKEEAGRITFQNGEMSLVINCRTGLIDEYTVQGIRYLKQEAFKALVLEDTDDSWKMDCSRFDQVAGEFGLMSPEEGTEFSGIRQGILPSVRVIEDGEVRSVVEAVFRYHHSFICQTYKLPKKGTEVEVQVRVNWSEKSKLLKLSVPTALEDGKYIGQVAYGIGELPVNGDEAVAQKWVGAVSGKTDRAVTLVNNGTYGSDYHQGEIRLTLLRSPGFCGHPIMDRPILPQDRFSPRVDQGERLYTFWLNGGTVEERAAHIDREALVHNEVPCALSFFPSGQGKPAASLLEIQDNTVQLTAFKKAQNGRDYVLRLFEPTGESRETTLSLPSLGLEQAVRLSGFEVKTLLLNPEEGTLTETDLMEKPTP